ncbi:uncharacterized protein LOC143541575 [Bidens hawaiensis]|uniref:uncharacterized protein LOC143541575 n=1 Tax=Bidens hawaiensis TaxID=980011 RepID=UPI00404A5C8D
MKPTCPWTLHISRQSVEDNWRVKAIPRKHDCLISRTIGLYTMSTIAKEIEVELQTTPNLSAKELKAKFQQMHQVQLSESKMRRAKTTALQRKDGDHTKQYTHLRSYIDELLKANPVDFEGVTTAVGTGGNNCLYHVAFAIVEAECTYSLKWFLDLLGDDLNLPDDANFTFISDRQKGLIQAVESVFPRAEHWFYCRHIHENLRQTWRGDLYKGLFYRAASATSVPYFNMAMEEIKKTNLDMFLWLSEIPAARWSRSNFLGRTKSDMLLNNLCESFNKQLVGARDKLIITCLEYIREYLTMRIVTVKKMQATARGPLTPQATKAWDEIQTEQAN